MLTFWFPLEQGRCRFPARNKVLKLRVGAGKFSPSAKNETTNETHKVCRHIILATSQNQILNRLGQCVLAGCHRTNATPANDSLSPGQRRTTDT